MNDTGKTIKMFAGTSSDTSLPEDRLRELSHEIIDLMEKYGCLVLQINAKALD